MEVVKVCDRGVCVAVSDVLCAPDNKLLFAAACWAALLHTTIVSHDKCTQWIVSGIIRLFYSTIVLHRCCSGVNESPEADPELIAAGSLTVNCWLFIRTGVYPGVFVLGRNCRASQFQTKLNGLATALLEWPDCISVGVNGRRHQGMRGQTENGLN